MHHHHDIMMDGSESPRAISMVVVNSSRAGEPSRFRRTRTEDDDEDGNDEEQQQHPSLGPGSREYQSRLKAWCAVLSGLLVPLTVILFLIFPAAIVVVIMIVFCIVPVALLLCMGCLCYMIAPETSSTFTMMWGSGVSQSRWEMDWPIPNHLHETPRTREELEKLLVVKIIVRDEQVSKPAKESDSPETPKNEENSTVLLKKENKAEDDGSAESEFPDVEAVNTTSTEEEEEEVIDSLLEFDPKTMIRRSHILKTCCDICMLDYEIGDEISESKNLDCDHIFHKECILDWMQKRHTCPCCRRNYLGEADDSEVITPGWRENL